MSRLTRVIAPMLRPAGPGIREVSRADGEARELAVTSPQFPTRGRVVINREGFMEWDYRGRISDDAGAADIAAVIIAVMASRPGGDGQRHDRRPTFQPAAERDRPRP